MFRATLWACCVWLSFSASLPADDRCLEISYEGEMLRGRVVARDSVQCWFQLADGSQRLIDLAKVSRYQVLPGEFSPMTTVEMKSQLVREWPALRVAATDGLIVAAPASVENELKELFDEVRRDFVGWLSVYGHTPAPLEFPLVVVMPSRQAEFDQLVKIRPKRARENLAGVYLVESNRILLSPGEKHQSLRERHATLIHEAVHQLGFNYGLHSRIEPGPVWMIEGLAMAFENDALRKRDRQASAWDRINRERFLHFRAMQQKMPRGWLRALIESDDLFETRALDAYAQAWAVTFFLLETRPSQYVRLLTTSHEMERKADESITSRRLRHFIESLGKEPESLEIEIKRFFEELSPRSR
ncbi:hypothetical protein Plim_1652 [Planctopirus limnophila DSM 3776]|uniref:DUF1570 domain-containing protein n=1 Tax=Planctopirus limnophila (strain ATCC 43296 / DSM 3776 / IFAM 1008 / Mu 290) TaxID=521674 RepID=D5SWY4_PLAL2|nr:DUF1570 domain-containing protein [Planctopirus limnophila]ADG67484.1 hypothetical protein Plim_1652 [Planctopirus limnophila DSM 3776]